MRPTSPIITDTVRNKYITRSQITCVWETSITLYLWEQHENSPSQRLRIRLITHQSSCKISAAVTHRREQGRTGNNPEGEGICWVVLTASFFSFPARSASLSLLPSLTQSTLSHPTAAVCFLGKAERRKISLSLFQLFLSPHTFSLSLYCPLVLSLSHPPFPAYIFFHCPTSSALCTVYLCQSLNVCVLVYIYIWFRSLPQTKLDTKIRISYACLC